MSNLDSDKQKKINKAINMARLAYLESSLDEWEELRNKNGEAVVFNNEKVYRYKDKLEDSSLYLFELPRGTKRQMIEEHFHIGTVGFIQSVQKQFKETEPLRKLIREISRVLGLQEDQVEKTFTLAGPALETGFRLLVVLLPEESD